EKENKENTELIERLKEEKFQIKENLNILIGSYENIINSFESKFLKNSFIFEDIYPMIRELNSFYQKICLNSKKIPKREKKK
uniref:DUF115 domain-containing protein n=1 Tax=Meloidogyne hapla TaxID=6305 RepID=A0A1I8BIK7_MELHA